MFNLRRYFQLDPSVTYLNHGSFGATPRPVFHVYQDWQKRLENQPAKFLGRDYKELMSSSRTALGNYLNTSTENFIYTTNVTESINIVARSLRLGPDDEVLSTNHEYGALDRTWRFLSKEQGFKYINQSISVPFSSTGMINELWSGVTSRTRVIFMSHITSPTAIVFPVKEIIQRARTEGIITVIDGAHAPGQIPLDLDDLSADFYGGNLHKWLCSPKGAGFLYGNKNVQHLLKPLIVSWGYEAEISDNAHFLTQFDWTGTRDIAAFLSVPEAIEFQKRHNWETVRVACQELVKVARDGITDLSGLSPLFIEASNLQMISLPLAESVDIAEMKNMLYDKYHIEVPLITWNGYKLIRISVQGYNTRRDIYRLISALWDLGVGKKVQ